VNGPLAIPARIGAALAAALFLASLNPSEVVAAEPWIEVRSPGRATVVTDASEKAGRKVAFQVVQFDRALERRFSWIQGDGDSSLLVFASDDESMIRSMAPDGVDAEKDHALASYHVTSSGHVGALRAEVKDPSDKERSPFRGFYRGRAAHLVERSLGKSAPSWLSRGLVTFLADTVVKDKEILTGRMTLSEGDAAALRAPSSAEFFREGRASDRRSDLLAGMFIHYLLVGDGGKHAPVLNDWLESLAARDEAPVLQAALGKVMALYGGFPKHLASKKFSPLKLPADASLRSANLLVRPLPLAEALMLRAEALFDLNRPVDTRGLLRQVKEADPTLVRPLEIEAVLFEREQRSAESRQAIEAAIKLGSKDGSLYYRLAQTQWARTMARPALLATQTLLETARDLSPGDGPTLSYLAEVQSDLGLTEKALENARSGATLAPADVYARMSLARALWNARQVDEALTAAREALKVARVASQKQRVQEFITFATKNRRLQGRGTKPYTTQFGPPPAGAFGATRSAAGGTGRVNVGAARIDSADASAITDCFAQADDAACSRAVPALEVACADKQTTSCVSLGSLYDGGFGVSRDRAKAAAFYRIACAASDKAGCARLAVLEAQGLGVPRNAARAKKTLETLCAEKVPEGCIGLAQILERTGFRVDRDEAQRLLKATCDAGSAEACALTTGR